MPGKCVRFCICPLCLHVCSSGSHIELVHAVTLPEAWLQRVGPVSVSGLYCIYYPVRVPAVDQWLHAFLTASCAWIFMYAALYQLMSAQSGCSISDMVAWAPSAIFNVTTHVSINTPTPIQVDYRGVPKYVSHVRELMGESEWFLSLIFFFMCVYTACLEGSELLLHNMSLLFLSGRKGNSCLFWMGTV